LLRIHFLNVGHGDCTIIKHPSGRLTVVDINNSQEFDADSFAEELNEERQKASQKPQTRGLGMLASSPRNALTSPVGLASSNVLSSNSDAFSRILREYAADQAARAEVARRAKLELTDPIAFLKTHYPHERPFRFILTHPDLDHMRGVKSLYENVGITNIWDTLHTKPTPHYRSDADKEDWEFYRSLREGTVEITPKNYTRGDSFFAFGKEEDGRPGGDNIEILSPTSALVGRATPRKRRTISALSCVSTMLAEACCCRATPKPLRGMGWKKPMACALRATS
jgi:competence protein ComEC